MNKYGLIYADPPWSFRDKCNSGKRGASHKYSVMRTADICAFPIWDIADKDCLLAMWWVGAMPEDAIMVVKAWGFRLATMKGFTWVKLTKNGKRHFVMGHYTRANTEDCLFAVKGHPKILDHGISQLIESPIGAHSEKPVLARLKLEALLGDVKRVELFARQRFSGWDAWGNEVQSDAIFESGTQNEISV